MSFGTAATGGFRASDDDSWSQVSCANLIGVISTAMVSLLILARSISFIEIGPVGNLERLLVPVVLYWGGIVILLRGRVRLPWAFLLLLAPGIVMALGFREVDAGQILFPLVAIVVFILPVRWRPIALSVGILIVVTTLVLLAGALMGVNYRGGKGGNRGLPWLFQILPGMINVPSRTLALSLPLVLIVHQKQATGRLVTAVLVGLAILGILLTGSRANMAAALGFLLVVYVLKGGRRNWFLVTMVGCAGVVAITAFLMSGRESPFRWDAVSRMATETSMLVNDVDPSQNPLARSIITASAISVIQESWIVGHGNSHDKAARAWADRRGLFIQRQLNRDGKWHLHIHGSFFIMAAKSGLPAALAFFGGLGLLVLRAVRLRGISGANVVVATFVMVMFSQIGGHTLSKVFCLVVLGLVFAAAEHPGSTGRREITSFS